MWRHEESIDTLRNRDALGRGDLQRVVILVHRTREEALAIAIAQAQVPKNGGEPPEDSLS